MQHGSKDDLEGLSEYTDGLVEQIQNYEIQIEEKVQSVDILTIHRFQV